MADEPNPTPPTPQSNPTQGNDPAARTLEGTLKEPTPSPEPAKQPDSAAAKAPEPGKEPAKDPAKPAAGPPEKYEFKAPEGLEIDAKAVEAITPIFKELSLTQEQAQKLVDFQAAREAAAIDENLKFVTETRNEWRGKITKDPVLGNGTDGFNDAAKKNIAVAIAAAGDEKAVTALKEAFDLTGAGDNPAIAAALNTIGKLLSEGTAVRGGGPAPTGQTKPGSSDQPTPARALYPNLPSSAA